MLAGMALVPIYVISPSPYSSRSKRMQSRQLLKVTSFLLSPPPFSFLLHLLGQLARCGRQTRHRLRRQHEAISQGL